MARASKMPLRLRAATLVVAGLGLAGWPAGAFAEDNPIANFFNSLGNAAKSVVSGEVIADSYARRDNNRTGRTSSDPIPAAIPTARNRNTQIALNSLGYSAGNPDGIFGPQTRRAVSQFQSSVGHNPTGYLTDEERDLLIERSRDPNRYAVRTPPGADPLNPAGGLRSGTAAGTAPGGVKDQLPASGSSAYFDADEPEEEALEVPAANSPPANPNPDG